MPRSTEGPPDHVGPTVMELRLGDRLELSKPHACGGSTWRVVRLGADIGLKCETCTRRVLMVRAQLERRFRSWVARVEPA